MSGPELTTANMAQVWQAAKEFNTSFTIGELHEKSGVPRSSIQHMVARWMLKGHLTSNGASRNARFEIAQTTQSELTGRDQRIWNIMRRFRTFTIRDVAAWSSLPEEPVSEQDVLRFLRPLLDAEYVRRRRKAKPGHHPAEYQMLRNTGPFPPMQQRVQVLYDPNTTELVPNAQFRKRFAL